MVDFVRRTSGPALMVLMFVASGCGESGPKLVSAAGKVSEAGRPVAGAAVMFSPTGGEGAQPAEGTTEDDGSFELSTGDRSGVAPGKYLVNIIKAPPGGASSEAFMDSMAPTDPREARKKKQAESDPTEFTFQREVTSEGGDLDFDLQSEALSQQ